MESGLVNTIRDLLSYVDILKKIRIIRMDMRITAFLKTSNVHSLESPMMLTQRKSRRCLVKAEVFLLSDYKKVANHV